MADIDDLLTSDSGAVAQRAAAAARVPGFGSIARRGRTRRTRRQAAVVGAVAMTVAGIVGVTQVMGPGGGDAPPGPAEDGTVVTPSPRLSLMGGPDAELPAWVTEREGLPVEDLAHVGDVDRLRVYASRAGDDWCVVLAIEPTPGSDGSDWVAAVSCAPSGSFARSGVPVEARSSSYSGAALLLPDDFSGEVGPEWVRVDDNLAVRH